MIQFIEKKKTTILKCFLGECKNVFLKKKIFEYIIDEIEISSDDSDREDFDEDNSDEEN